MSGEETEHDEQALPKHSFTTEQRRIIVTGLLEMRDAAETMARELTALGVPPLLAETIPAHHLISLAAKRSCRVRRDIAGGEPRREFWIRVCDEHFAQAIRRTAEAKAASEVLLWVVDEVRVAEPEALAQPPETQQDVSST
jgi:hypothetical protein